MHDLSFALSQPVFAVNGLRFAVQIYTFENAYGLDGTRCTVAETADGCSITCDRLTWAGGQEVAPGSATIRVVVGPGTTTLTVDAACGETIRCVKLLLVGMPEGEVVSLREAERRSIPDEGLILHYPNGWRELATPLVVLRTAEGVLRSFRSLDPRVREKRVALLHRDGGLDVELIHEEEASGAGRTISVPAWEVGSPATVDEVYARHAEAVTRNHGLLPWESRPDVPGWARDVSLVAAIHGQHWTGYIFNDYAAILGAVEWLAARIEPRRILAYLPGWEGRYYWQYGDYRPDPRMGGEQGFARLVDGAGEMGVRLMPMFGINYANRGMANFERWGAPALSMTAGGIGGGRTCDWDGSRHYDHGWGALLNPGAPTWQNRLVEQISALVDRYGFEAVFLDISAVWQNDPTHNVHEGVMELAARLKRLHPGLLVAGEGWYDAVGAATPLMQSGHTDGDLHWHDVRSGGLFEHHARGFGHLCIGDPGRGSTGVHELGTNPTTRVPLRRAVLPTVTIVEDTLSRAPEAVREILRDAEDYAARFLTESTERTQGREVVSIGAPARSA